uniref:Vacuolar protein sorting-associated protein 52 homolog n=1 Tax=Globodera rostochiensis TaxID=31243 RepID=A0A914HU87_GLORO
MLFISKIGLGSGGWNVASKGELRKAEELTVEDCIGQADKIADLASEIDECDGALESIERMLVTFLDELGTISTDMQHLKQQSVEINHQLHNRQRVRAELSQFVDDMVVPHTMIKTIIEKEVNGSEFLEQLHELQHKLQFIKTQQFKDAKSVGDVHDVVENLKYKAMEKIREWLLLKISLFRKPLTNYQITQNALLKNRFFYEFLLANDRQVAREVKDEYVDTTSKMFFSYFKAYLSRLFKFQMTDSATKSDLLGAEDVVKQPAISALPNLFMSGKHHHQTRSRATVFSLGHRQNVLLDDLLAPLIVPHVAQENNETFQFESLFRSVQYALVDHCSHEFLFICDFFMVNDQSAVDLFTSVMGRSTNLILKLLEEKIAVNFDAISLFLCICFCAKFRELMIDRAVVPIDDYWDTLGRFLWGRLDAVMTAHNDSVRAIDVRKMPVDSRPHYVCRRYAELTCSLLVCSELASKGTDSRLQEILSRQQAEIEGLLNRLATQLKTKKERLVFQINNYDVVLTVLNERVLAESKERGSFWELQQTKMGTYVEEVLSPHFAPLIQFVNECEPLVEQNHSQLLARYTGKVVQIIRTFSAEWRRSIESINNEILHSFTNLKNGANILQMAFTQFISYYQRLNKVLSHDVFQNCHSEELVSYQHIAETIKKYKPIF